MLIKDKCPFLFKPDYKENKFQKYTRWVWKGGIYLTIAIITYFLAIQLNFLWLFGKMPSFEQLENPPSSIASEIYTADGKLMGKYYRENRTPVEYNQISKHVINALISTEDVRFKEHHGVDVWAAISAIGAAIRGEKRGASTITQQLAKNMFKTRNQDSKGLLGYIPVLSTIIAKSKEWMVAIKLENAFSKEEIITMYLNTVDFGSNSFGIKVAAKTYYKTTPDSLKVEQASVLIGMLKATTYYHPKLNPNRAFLRRNVVMSQMMKYGHITRKQYDSLATLPLRLKFKVDSHDDGPGTYFRGALSSFLEKWCAENNLDLYSGGLKIYTTLDSRIQKHAEAALQERMARLQKTFYIHWKDKNPWVDDKDIEIKGFIEKIIKRAPIYKSLKAQYGTDEKAIFAELNKPKKMRVFGWEGEIDTVFSSIDSLKYYKHFMHAGFMVQNHQTGEIMAWVGGINFKYFKYDHVSQSRRQPGSTFKPFAYCAAIESGMYPCVKMMDVPVHIRYKEIRKSLCVKPDDVKYKDVEGVMKTWSPHNSDWVFTQDTMSLRRAMGKSVNSITAQITEKVGWEKVVNTAHKLGIKSPLDTVPSICLGSSDVSLFELTGAYATFFNKGVHIDPYFVTRIEDQYGNLIHEFVPKQKQVISEETAFLMQHMLKGGLEEPGGTAQALFSFNLFRGNEFAGKTGTSSNHSDGWFVGATKDLIGVSWVGGEDRSIHFRTSAMGEGSKTALPIFGMFMEKIYEDDNVGIKMGYFPKPKIKITKPYNCPTKLRPKADTLATDSLDLKMDTLKIR
jgi:penicillin-binding protein 1A